MTILASKSPWRTVEHDGERYMVRENADAVWAVRLDAERDCFLWDGNAPQWALAKPEPVQGELL